MVRQLQAQGKSHIRLLASTDDLDARDNTFSTYTSTHKGVPIFWYKGAIVANDYEDLYDGTWQNEDKPRLHDGTLVMDLTKEYWTGSDNDGTAKTRGGVSKALGHSEVETGILNHATGDPLSHAADDPTEIKSMYAITGIYIIENHQPIGIPSITGAPRVGETLTADTSAITNGNGTDRATFTSQWFETDENFYNPIAGATSKTYTPTADVAGKSITVDVKMTDNHGYKTPFLSNQIDPTEPIQPTDLIVKNDELGTLIALNPSSNSHQAQGFTAASDAEPYSLTEVRISFAAVDDPTAASTEITLTINAESSGFPGEELCTLSNPSRIAGSGLSTFEAPDSCPPLTPGNTYYVVIARGADASGDIEVNLTGTPGQHEGSAPGWTLDFPLDVFNNGTWVQSVFTNNIVLDIRGEISTELPAPENWPLTPTGLIGGDKFRLLFITYTGHSSANTDIENYNAYVKSQANAGNAHAAIKPYSYWFRVLGSTEDVSARDNTMTTGTGVPIYWMGGDKVADNYGDFYDGSWDSEMSSGRAGIPSSSAYALWTGSENNGTRASANGVYQTLGTASVRIGSLNGSGDPLSSLNTTPGTNYHYYALSNIFIAPNSDATGQPAITGTPRVNETLSVDTSGITDPEGTDNAVFTYQWVRVDGSVDNDISGATNASYRLTDADAEKQIKVKVSFQDDQGFAEGPLESEPTDTIVAADVLVRNTGQAVDSSANIALNITTISVAQQFTTGTESDGYILESIGMRFTNIASPSTAGSELTATLNEDSSGQPGNTLCTLDDPPNFRSSGVNTFTVPTSGSDMCPTLAASTTYYLVIKRDNNTDAIIVSGTDTSAEDTGSEPGWVIGDGPHSYVIVSWSQSNNQPLMIEVKGASVVESIVSTHRTWVDNRRGDAATEYENTGDFTIAQGFRTGGTAGVYEVHEISIDFDQGQPDPAAMQVRIVESSSLKAVDDEAIPTTYWKGGNFPARRIGADAGTHTFTLSLTQVIGANILEANTNYFITIESTSNDSSTAAVVRMTESHNQTSDDGWAVDNHVYVKHKTDGSGWTRNDHQARIRIAGEYHEGISIVNEPRAYESCHGNLTNNRETLPEGFESCAFATQVDVGTPGSFPSNLSGVETTAWLPLYETIDFKIVIWPLVPAGGWVDVKYATEFPPGIYAHGSPATAHVDYIKTSGKVRFLPGEIAKTASINIIDDRHEDSNEYVQVNLPSQETRHSSVDNYSLIRRSAFGTIYNTEETVEMQSLNVSDLTVTEGEGATASFNVWLSGEVTAPVLAHYATQDGSAKAGEHYTAASGTLLIPHGQTSVTVSVPILNDEVYTGERKFKLTISDPINAEILDESGEATIKDDEPGPLQAYLGTIPSSHNGASSFTFTVTFSENVSTKDRVMKNDVFTVTNGEITQAERLMGQRNHWKMTVQPDDGADLTITLPETADCSDTGAVCTQAAPYRPLSNGFSASLTGTPLTAQFNYLGYSHNSVDPFSFELAFSEEVDTTPEEIKDNALTITRGRITSITRKEEGSNLKWKVTIQPDGRSGVSINMDQATDCEAAGHICTQAGELLTASVSGYVSGPVQISVADASVSEADDAVLAFEVTLKPKFFLVDITVDYATQDGAAQAGQDYTAASGTLTFRPGHPSQTIQVPVLTDSENEDPETMTLTLSNPTRSVLADAEATGTIEESDASSETEGTTANTEPTGLPTISGTPEVDQTLTASVSGVGDADGLTNPGFTYQWVAGSTDISGATKSTHFLTSSEQGQTIQVQVSFTDDAENQETLTSIATEAVAARSDNTVWQADMLVIEYNASSIGAASSDLFANVGGSGSLEIRSLWSYIPDRDLRLAFAAGVPNAENMTLQVGDLVLEFPAGSSGNGSFKWTEIDVDWEDGETIAVSITTASTSTEADTPAPDQANTPAAGAPTISGTPQVGQELTADTTGISDADGLTNVSYRYQWVGNDGTTDADILNTAASTYTPSASDVGKTIKVQVTFTDDADNEETLTSAASDTVAATKPGAPGHVNIFPHDTGALDVYWEAPASDGGSAITGYKVQWKETTDSWDTAADVSEATVTGTTQTITGLTDGVEYTVRVKAVNDVGEGPPSAEVSGTPEEAQIWSATLTVGIVAETFAGYTTFLPDSTVLGALSSDTITLDDASYTVKALGVLNGKLILSVMPKLTAGFVLVVGTDEFTSTDASTHEGDAIIQFQWNDPGLDLPEGEEVAVRLTEPADNTPATGEPTITGTTQVGETLTVDTSGIQDSNGLTNVIFEYQWMAADTEIDDATDSTYTPSVSDVGKTISVRVNFRDDAGYKESVTIQATEAVLATVPTEPLSLTVATGNQIQELDASWQAPSSNGGSAITGYKVQWKEAADSWDTEADVSEATETGTTHTVTGLTGGVEYAVRVMATNDVGDGPASTEAKGTPAGGVSEQTVEPENTVPTGLPTISGTPQVGKTLTANTSSISDAEGLTNVSYRYQWLGGGSDISGATGSSHLLTTGQQGQTVQVKVTFTDDADNQESLTSAETLAVAAKPNTAATGDPTISGTPQVDETLTADVSGIRDEDGLTNVSYQYQWLRDDADIAGQTRSTYELVSADEGKTIKVRVTFNDDAGNAESLTSTATTPIAAQPAETPVDLLTASFANVPADHNGGNFTFQLTFSENVEAGYARIRDHAFTVTGATIDSASRITQGSNQGWNVEVNPTSNEAITITLPETTDCNAARAICTDDERKLSHATSEIVAGPPAISVSDANVQEAEGAVLEFSVTLSHTSTRTVTVSYATSDGTATASSDYTARSGTITFNAGDTSQTVSVTVLTDSDNEGQETLTLTLSNPNQATLDDATGTGTIKNGESSSGTEEDPPEEDPPAEDPPADTPVVSLTASFSNMPATHNGSTFTFDLSFSENVKAGYERIRDHAFTISGGKIANAQRKTQGSNQSWTITVKPDGNGAITITLPETTDCDADGAICTSDGRKLSGSTSTQVTGPV